MSRIDRVRIEEVRRRAGIYRELTSIADQRVLRWFWQVERMDEYRLAGRVLMADVSGGRVRGRPSLSLMDGVKMTLVSRGMTMRLRERYEEVESPCAYPCLVLRSFAQPTRSLVDYHLVGGMALHDAVGVNCKIGATT